MKKREHPNYDKKTYFDQHQPFTQHSGQFKNLIEIKKNIFDGELAEAVQEITTTLSPPTVLVMFDQFEACYAIQDYMMQLTELFKTS